jgi:hypothetical protein
MTNPCACVIAFAAMLPAVSMLVLVCLRVRRLWAHSWAKGNLACTITRPTQLSSESAAQLVNAGNWLKVAARQRRSSG